VKKIYIPNASYKLIHGIFTKNLSSVNKWLKSYTRRLLSSRMQI
jgi:hypothetical protein